MGEKLLSHGVLFCKRSNDTQKWQPEGNEETDEKYVGDIKNGLPSGKGTSTYPEWKKYIGKWKEGKRNGQGKETFENGCIYEGQFKDDKYNGQGSFTAPNGAQFSGKYEDGELHGKGILISPEGDKYEGQFKSGKQHGKGIYKWNDGRIYEGQFKDGKMHGIGKYIMEDGRYFEGSFKKGNPTKKGKYFWEDGTEYIEEEKKGLTITKAMLGEPDEDDEIIEISDKEREDFLKEITCISDDDGEIWTCAHCEFEQESTVEKYALQHGLVCPSCFDSVMGFDQESFGAIGEMIVFDNENVQPDGSNRYLCLKVLADENIGDENYVRRYQLSIRSNKILGLTENYRNSKGEIDYPERIDGELVFNMNNHKFFENINGKKVEVTKEEFYPVIKSKDKYVRGEELVCDSEDYFVNERKIVANLAEKIFECDVINEQISDSEDERLGEWLSKYFGPSSNWDTISDIFQGCDVDTSSSEIIRP